MTLSPIPKVLSVLSRPEYILKPFKGDGISKEVNLIMKKASMYLLLFIYFLSIFCCSQEKKDESEILAKINDYALTLDEFHSQLAAELEMDRDFKITKEAKKEFLEGLIKKEILIQEAKKRDLDRKEKFIRAIEHYWESTLIRDLMEAKGKEIEKRTIISQEEIESRYKEMKKSEAELPPLEDIKVKIERKMIEQKKHRALKEWIDDLRKKAHVEVNQELLSK